MRQTIQNTINTIQTIQTIQAIQPVSDNLISVEGPRPKLHETLLLVEWEVKNVDGAR